METSSGSSRRVKQQRNPAAYLSDDLLVEILSWLPARHLSRCKCVSRGWRDLISHPDHRRRLAQPFLGFFHHARVQEPPWPTTHFTAVYPPAGGPPPLAVDPAFPFLPSSYTRPAQLLDSCNGLLLLSCRRAGAADQNEPPAAAPFYVVCNPTSQDWVELPEPTPAPGAMTGTGPFQQLLQTILGPNFHLQPRREMNPSALAFDPAVSSHFHVFRLVERDDPYPWPWRVPGQHGHTGTATIAAVQVFSSETGRWVLRDSEWSYPISFTGQHAYLDGVLHFTTSMKGVVASVDTKGQTWRTTRVSPEHPATLGDAATAFLGQSQGRLLYVDAKVSGNAPELSVYALQRCGGGVEAQYWILKHRTRLLDSAGQMWFGKQHSVLGIHPDRDMIFLFDERRWRVVAYAMDHRTASVVHSFTGHMSCNHRYLPYTPFYSSKRLSMLT